MKEILKDLLLSLIPISLMFLCYLIGYRSPVAQADQPHTNCECRELTRIRLLLEHQFGVICDERHCEGSSSSSNGGIFP